MESVKYNNHNLIIRMLCLFMVVILCLFMIPSGSAQAVAGFDDAIIFSILNQAFMSAAGANFVVGSNGIPVSESDPISEDLFDILTTKSDLDSKFYDIVGQNLSDFIDSIDWDNVFTVASGTSNIIANLPKVAVDTLTLFAKGLISELGATSDTAIDWNTDTGNISSSYSTNFEGFYTRVTSASDPAYYLEGSGNRRYDIYIQGEYEYPIYCFATIINGAFYHGFFSKSNYPNGQLTSSGYYIYYGAESAGWGQHEGNFQFSTFSDFNELLAIFNQTETPLVVDDLTMTLVPESDTEAMVYPETAVEDYPNVESIPYYTDIPYTGTVPDTGVIPYTEAIPYLQEAVRSNTLTASLEDTQEGTITVPDGSVTIPLFNITLPDFQFNFTGIWYYVVQWVNSLGAWLSQMFTIWGILPASMVYPVWATAVIVIVLGVYKRFFM